MVSRLYLPTESPSFGLGLSASLLGLGVFIAGGLVASGLLLSGSAVDRDWFKVVNAWGPAGAILWSSLSVLGLGLAAFLLAGAVGPRRPQVLASIVIAMAAGGLVVQLCKLAFGAARPLASLGPDGVQVIGIAMKAHAMPSGHAALGFCGACIAAACIPQAWSAGWRWMLTVACLATACLMALARVAVGAHWPSDVLTGAGIGLATGLVLVARPAGCQLVDRLAFLISGRVGSRMVAASLVAAAAAMWVAPRDYPLAEFFQGGVALVGLSAALAWWRRHPRREYTGVRPSAQRKWQPVKP